MGGAPIPYLKSLGVFLAIGLLAGCGNPKETPAVQAQKPMSPTQPQPPTPSASAAPRSGATAPPASSPPALGHNSNGTAKQASPSGPKDEATKNQTGVPVVVTGLEGKWRDQGGRV